MKKTLVVTALFAFLLPAISFSQFTFTNGNSSLELSGYLIGFYQYRPQFAGDPNAGNYSKNTFDLDDARFNIKGWTRGGLKFEIELNMADIIAFIQTPTDQTAVPLTEAYIAYLNPYLNLKAGYFKLPFSPSSLIDKVPSPFLARATVADGSYFSRRDAGAMIFKDLWHQRINLYAGICSGDGELILAGVTDPNGKPEYFARIELSSAYYRLEELDKRDLQVPLARIGADVRYNDKSQFTGAGTGSTTYALDNVMNIDGKKISYGADAAFMWHGFSAQFEMDWAHMIAAPNTPLAMQLAAFDTKYFRNGGFLVQANYYNKLLRSAFAVRYDEFNPSDLVGTFNSSGDFLGAQQRTVTFAYNFFALPYNLTLKFHYALRLKQPDISQKWKEDVFRGGVQYTF
jgi:Phosphate-selective porin O and P